jgi:hypothetical protein
MTDLIHEPRANDMSLRDYLAANVMQQIIGQNIEWCNAGLAEQMAEKAYRAADAMLAARSAGAVS